MDLDIRTILVLSAVNALVVGAAILITARSNSGSAKDMKDWGIACLLQSAGWVLIALRGRVPDALSIVIGNTALVMSYGLFYRALKEFNREEYFTPGPLILVAAVFVLLCYFTFVTPSVVARSVVMGAAAGILFFLSASLALSRKQGPRAFSHLLTGGAFVVFLLVAAARVSYLVFVDGTMSSIFTKNPMQELLFATSCVSVSVLTFGFILMCNDRSRAELVAALQRVKTLTGLLPICSTCKSIRDDQGYWLQIEEYVREHSEADFSHSICPDCARRLFPGKQLTLR